MIRFQIELAHWYYIDEYVSDPQYKHLRLKQCHFRDFLEHVLRHVGFLRDFVVSSELF